VTTLRYWLRRPWFARIGVIAVLFALWEMAARWWIDPMFLSPPSRVFLSLQAVFDTRGVPASSDLPAGDGSSTSKASSGPKRSKWRARQGFVSGLWRRNGRRRRSGWRRRRRDVDVDSLRNAAP